MSCTNVFHLDIKLFGANSDMESLEIYHITFG